MTDFEKAEKAREMAGRAAADWNEFKDKLNASVAARDAELEALGIKAESVTPEAVKRDALVLTKLILARLSIGVPVGSNQLAIAKETLKGLSNVKAAEGDSDDDRLAAMLEDIEGDGNTGDGGDSQ